MKGDGNLFLDRFQSAIPRIVEELAQLTVSMTPKIAKLAKEALSEFCLLPDVLEIFSERCPVYVPLAEMPAQSIPHVDSNVKIRRIEIGLQENYEEWICQLASAFSFNCSCYLLRILQRVLEKVKSLAELIIPYIFMHLALDLSFSAENFELLSANITELLMQWILNTESSNEDCIKQLIHCLDFLRNFYHEWKLEEWQESSETARVPVKWKTIYWLDVDYSLVATAAYQAKLPATALLYTEQWCLTRNESLKIPEFECTQGFKSTLEELIVQIYRELDDIDAFRVAVEDLDIKQKISAFISRTELDSSQECTMTLPVDVQDFTTSHPVFVPDSATELHHDGTNSALHTNEKLWEEEMEKLDIFMHSWSPCCSTEEHQEDRNIELYIQMQKFKESLPADPFISLECIKHRSSYDNYVYFLESMEEALERMKEQDAQQKDRLLEKWKQRSSRFQNEGNTDILKKFLDLQVKLVDCLNWREKLPDLLLERIESTRKLRDFSSASSAIHLLEELTTKLTSESIQRFHGASSWIHVEKAKLLWSEDKSSSAIRLAKFMIKEIKGCCHLDSFSFDGYHKVDDTISQQQLYDASVLCEWLCLLSQWIFTSQLEPFDQVITLMTNSEAIMSPPEFYHCPDYQDVITKAHYQFACYADHQYNNLVQLVEAMECRINSPAIVAKRKEIESIRKRLDHESLSESEGHALKTHLYQLDGPLQADLDQVKELKLKRDHSILLALENYSKCLQCSEKHDLKIVFRLFQLWFDHQKDQEVNQIMDQYITHVGSYKFLPVLDQIASRLNLVETSHKVESYFLKIVRGLLREMCLHHPFHTLPRIIALRNGDLMEEKKKTSSRTVQRIIDLDKVQAAKELLNECSGSSNHMHRIISQMELLFHSYMHIAFMKKPHTSESMKIPFPPDLLCQTQNLEAVPVFTCILGVQSDGQYSFASFKSFGKSIMFQNGLSGARVIEVEDSNGLKFKEIVKCGDDLHQDAILQQLFEVSNHLLRDDLECRKRKLQMQTYRVIPLSPVVGLVQWIEKTIQLSEYLLGHKKDAGAHRRYRNQHQWTFRKCFEKLKDSSYADRRKVYREICENFPPVLHFFFLESNGCALGWYKTRMAFTRSVAVSSIIGYVVGLGDRHLDNILIRKDTFEIVHIDLGVAFDQGMFLPIPEIVPFRLTPDLVDGIGLHGVHGAMTKCCELTLKVLKENRDCLRMIFEVFVHDPLSSWTMTSIYDQSLLAKDENEQGSSSRQGIGSNVNAKRVANQIQQKLQGVSKNEILSTEGQCSKLIQDAQDPRNLSQMYCGWAPWL